MARDYLRSLWSALSGAAPLADRAAPAVSGRHVQVLNDLRSGMMALAEEVQGEQGFRLRRQLSAAADLQGLWFLRTNLSLALSSIHGEDGAMARIESVSAPARALLPRSLAAPARPRRLH